MSRVTQSIAEGVVDRRPERAHLFLALHADRPSVRGAAFPLVAELSIGGGDRTECINDKLVIDDRYMSTAHAKLTRTLTTWTLHDAGSKNGCFVNGRRVKSQILAEGDVVEIGRTFFVFRTVEDRDDPPDDTPAFRTLLPSLRADFATLARIARSDVPVILFGETGTGKEVLAHAIHVLSDRKGELVPFNCGALTDNLLHAELFGYRQGAFSGATEDRPGIIRSAHTGTLFLDEIAELREPAQVALLRVLEQKEVLPVGGTKRFPVDIRVVAASHRDLRALETFRDDLYNRLAGYTFRLPPLRERREDMAFFTAAMLPDGASFTPAAARRLFAYEWPGNLRELQKSLAAAVVIANGAPIALEHLPFDNDDEPEPDLDDADMAQRSELERLLRQHAGNIAAVGRELGKAPGQIRRWVRRYAIDLDQFRK